MENIQLVCLEEKRFQDIMNGNIKLKFFETIPFDLYVDGVCVVSYSLILGKYNGLAEGVSCAEVQYFNYFFEEDNEDAKKYVGKGYVKAGLNMLTEYAFNLDVPYLRLDIHESNIPSTKVAQGCGFIKHRGSFYKLHPNVRELYEGAIGDKLARSHDRIMESFDKLLQELGYSPSSSPIKK